MKAPSTRAGASEWQQLVSDLLDGDAAACDRARTRLWTYVWKLVQRQLRLPIGPLNDDADEKANIAVAVLKKLEAENYRRLREWRDKGQASFGRYLEVVATRVAIDHARAHPRQIAPRRQPFVWIAEDAHDPMILAESVQRQLDFFAGASVPQLSEHLERFSTAVAPSHQKTEVAQEETASRQPDSPARCVQRSVSKHVLRRR